MWTVEASSRVEKQINKLPKPIRDAFYLLQADLESFGPEAKRWTNYGKMVNKKEVYHCHLNKSKPRYVAIWKVTDFNIQIIEVKYVGTHENADYDRFK